MVGRVVVEGVEGVGEGREEEVVVEEVEGAGEGRGEQVVVEEVEGAGEGRGEEEVVEEVGGVVEGRGEEEEEKMEGVEANRGGDEEEMEGPREGRGDEEVNVEEWEGMKGEVVEWDVFSSLFVSLFSRPCDLYPKGNFSLCNTFVTSILGCSKSSLTAVIWFLCNAESSGVSFLLFFKFTSISFCFRS